MSPIICFLQNAMLIIPDFIALILMHESLNEKYTLILTLSVILNAVLLTLAKYEEYTKRIKFAQVFVFLAGYILSYIIFITCDKLTITQIIVLLTVKTICAIVYYIDKYHREPEYEYYAQLV